MSVFSDISIETLYYNIWPKCEFADLLRIRRSCAVGLRLVNDYLQGNAHLVPELEIDESEKNMEIFLQMGIPVTRVFINNSQSGIKYYDKWNASVTTFLNLYGSKITHLRLAHLGMIPSTSERNFIDRLTNLRSLTARNWVLNVSKEFFEGNVEISSVDFSELCPAVYNQLTNLDISLENNCNQPLDNSLIIATLCNRYLHNLSWPNLRRLALPELPQGLFLSSLITAEYQPTPNVPSLKTISFQYSCNTYENLISNVSEMELKAMESATFIKLAWLCCQRDIFLEMVNSAWFMSAKVISQFLDYDKAVKSLVNLHPSVVISVQFPFLERLEISTASSNIYHIVEIRSPSEVAVRPARNRPLWPSLEKLRILVDSILTGGAIEMIPYHHPHIEHEGDGYGILAKGLEYPPHCPSLLFRFLFNSYILECLKELTIDFKDSHDVWSINQSVARWIAMSCPNVTRFSTTNWNGSSRDFYTVWMGMPSLEELVICNCRAIDIHAFSGEEITDPSIVRRTSLKKLSLLGLEQMNGLSNDLFLHVISQLRLTHLYLNSAKPLQNVTVEGIRSLQAGPFGRSIIKFPFKDWSLDSCTPQQFETLSKEFRSYEMI